jgi:hypothetical protein
MVASILALLFVSHSREACEASPSVQARAARLHGGGIRMMSANPSISGQAGRQMCPL